MSAGLPVRSASTGMPPDGAAAWCRPHHLPRHRASARPPAAVPAHRTSHGRLDHQVRRRLPTGRHLGVGSDRGHRSVRACSRDVQLPRHQGAASRCLAPQHRRRPSPRAFATDVCRSRPQHPPRTGGAGAARTGPVEILSRPREAGAAHERLDVRDRRPTVEDAPRHPRGPARLRGCLACMVQPTTSTRQQHPPHSRPPSAETRTPRSSRSTTYGRAQPTGPTTKLAGLCYAEQAVRDVDGSPIGPRSGATRLRR